MEFKGRQVSGLCKGALSTIQAVQIEAGCCLWVRQLPRLEVSQQRLESHHGQMLWTTFLQLVISGTKPYLSLFPNRETWGSSSSSWATLLSPTCHFTSSAFLIFPFLVLISLGLNLLLTLTRAPCSRQTLLESVLTPPSLLWIPLFLITQLKISSPGKPFLPQPGRVLDYLRLTKQ